MKDAQMLLPAASLVEILGIMTLLTNESFIGPVDLGFSVPFLVSANLQGMALILAGGAVTGYATTQMK
jgi:hypothetical protein